MREVGYPLILTYHSISEGNSPLKTSPALFAQQMGWLRANARVVALSDILASLLNRTPIPKRAVALTFDDGFRDFYSSAAPVLHRLELPATIFLVSGRCGMTNCWPGQPAWVRPEDLLTWEQIAELSRQGFSFGAHSMTHSVLPELPVEEAKKEIIESRHQIEAHIDQSVNLFAYPYGRWNSVVRDIVRSQYLGACSTGAAVVGPRSDPFALPRVDTHYIRHPALFRMLFSPPFVLYLSTRRLIRRARGLPEGVYAKRES